MARRDFLHKNKLTEFLTWCDTQNIKHREGKGEYQVCQIFYKGSWHVIYSRIYMPEHLTIPNKLYNIVKQFITDYHNGSKKEN